MKKNKAVSATVYQTNALTTYTKAHKDLAKSHYSTSFRACQQGFVTPEKGIENENRPIPNKTEKYYPSESNEKKSRKAANRRAFRAISFFAKRHTALLGDMVQNRKRDRTAARERERSERCERKEGVTCWKIF